jgi:hypothetical protein
MGINETRYGFMDEGWATTFEYLISRADIGVEKADSAYKAFVLRDGSMILMLKRKFLSLHREII